jgi:hypothetical protein
MRQISLTLRQGDVRADRRLAAIAGISLLIGGIGLMNVVPVSVTEPTREIGNRLAIPRE